MCWRRFLSFQLRIDIGGFEFLEERAMLGDEVALVDFAFLAGLCHRYDGVREEILRALAEKQQCSRGDLVAAGIGHDQTLLAHEREQHFPRQAAHDQVSGNIRAGSTVPGPDPDHRVWPAAVTRSSNA